jgi:outer membrane protein OmpA-like peptidoglycan-associated protein
MIRQTWRCARALPLLFLLAFLPTGGTGGPDGFSEVEGLIEDARARGAELLSPKNFRTAEQEYAKAVELRDKGKSLKEIKKRLRKARQTVQSVLNNIKLAEVTFATVLPEREKAVAAGAEEHVPAEWTAVEEEFRKAVVGLEEGKVKRAKGMVERLITMYRDVELEAIRVDITGAVRALADSIEEEVTPWAPATYRRGVSLIEEADRVLDHDRYAREEAEARVRKAEYELRHAGALTKRISADPDVDPESVQLEREADLARIAEAIGLELRFDGGVESEIVRLVEEARELSRSNRELSSELFTLREEMAESQQLKESLQLRLDEERRKKERMSRVQSLFRVSEVKVLRDERNIVLRLVGFTFPAGTSTILPEYFNLLSRVREAIMEFPGSKVVIEGHTDAVGDEALNKALSQSRAESIQKYLVASLGVDPELIRAVGYGEERPIANNQTAEGRALNRRVEVVIQPAN